MKLPTNAEVDSYAAISAGLPVEVDLAVLARSAPTPPAFIVKDWMPEGEVTLLSGHGGSGKSAIALYFSVCIALGRPAFGIETQRRRVLFLYLEDGREILHWRLARICAWLGCDLADLEGWFVPYDGSHSDAALMIETRDGTTLTHVYEWLRAQMADMQVLVIDGASDSFGGNENARAQVRGFVRSLRRLVPSDGAVLLIGHVDKAAAVSGDTTQGYSGSTAWNNSVRARWYLRKDQDDLVLEMQKANHAAAGQSITIRWNAEASVFVADQAVPATQLERDLLAADDREKLVELIRTAKVRIPAAATGQRTAYHVLSALGLPQAYQRNKRRFWTDLDVLRNAGRVVEVPYRTADRKDRVALGVAE